MKLTILTDDGPFELSGELSWEWSNPHVTVIEKGEPRAAFACHLVRHILVSPGPVKLDADDSTPDSGEPNTRPVDSGDG